MPIASSQEELLAKVQRWQEEPPTEEEKIEFLRTAIEDMKDPVHINEFKDNIKTLGIAAVKTDESFDKVNRTLKKFVKDYGSDFPEVATFQQRWEGYQNDWSSLLQQSRNFANETSLSYGRYDSVFLFLVEDAENKQDMDDAARALEQFSNETPTEIPIDFSQQFQDLKGRVEGFQSDFNAYIERKQVELSEQAKVLQAQINNLLKEIEVITAAIAAAIAAIGVGAWWNLVISAVAGVSIIVLAKRRNDKKKELSQTQADLAKVNEKQEKLAHIKSEFDELDPDIKLICDSLQLFSDIWREFHEEAKAFAQVLRKAQEPSQLPEEFKLRVELARVTARPLKDALEAYANSV